MFAFLRSTVYVRVQPDRLSVFHVESGNEFSDVPIIAVEERRGKRAVAAFGRDANLRAGMPGISVANGFEHPRTLIADFVVAELTLKRFLAEALPWSLLSPSPVMVIHPLVAYEGGLTQIEIRALVELGLGAGARSVYLWEGPELSVAELRELRFSRPGGRLLHP